MCAREEKGEERRKKKEEGRRKKEEDEEEEEMLIMIMRGKRRPNLSLLATFLCFLGAGGVRNREKGIPWGKKETLDLRWPYLVRAHQTLVANSIFPLS